MRLKQGEKFGWKGWRSRLQADLGSNVTSTKRCPQTPGLRQDPYLSQQLAWHSVQHTSIRASDWTSLSLDLPIRVTG